MVVGDCDRDENSAREARQLSLNAHRPRWYALRMEPGADPVARADAPDVEGLEARLRFALDEVERLRIPDDQGSGERTARLAGLASWQVEVERLRGLIARERGGDPDAG